MYATQCVPFEECEFTIALSLENGPSRRYIPTSFKDKDERTC